MKSGRKVPSTAASKQAFMLLLLGYGVLKGIYHGSHPTKTIFLQLIVESLVEVREPGVPTRNNNVLEEIMTNVLINELQTLMNGISYALLLQSNILGIE